MTESTPSRAAETEAKCHEPLLRPGNTNCGGCGMSVALQMLSSAVGDRPIQMVIPACCGIVTAGPFPYSAYGAPVVAATFASAAAVDPAIPLTRTLYRDWDLEPFEWQGRHVDPHFIHLPGHRRAAPGAWCEAAIDGVVLYERDGAVTRQLGSPA